MSSSIILTQRSSNVPPIHCNAHYKRVEIERSDIKSPCPLKASTMSQFHPLTIKILFLRLEILDQKWIAAIKPIYELLCPSPLQLTIAPYFIYVSKLYFNYSGWGGLVFTNDINIQINLANKLNTSHSLRRTMRSHKFKLLASMFTIL